MILTSTRTVQSIRAAAQMEHRVVVALEKLWTLSRIMATYRVTGEYVRATAAKHGLTVARPSDNWVGRP